MPVTADVPQLVSSIYQAGRGERPWDEVIGSLAQGLGASGHLAYEVPAPEAGGGARVLANRGFSDDAMASFFSHYAGCNVWSASDAMKPGAVVTSSSLYPDDRLKGTEYWSGWLRHVDVFYVVGGIVHADPASSVKLSLVRPERGPRFDTTERDLLAGLVPHLDTALGAAKRQGQAARLLGPLLHTLDRLNQGVLVVRADGTVVHLNACGHAMLEGQTELRLVGDRLQFRSSDLRQRFEAYVAPASAQAACADLCFLLPGKPGSPRLQAALVALPADLAGARHYAMFIKEQRNPAAPADALRQLYGLSPAEAQLAAVLARGDTLADHADTRGISIHTARSQLKSLSLKLGVSRQAEIVHVVTSLAQGWSQPR